MGIRPRRSIRTFASTLSTQTTSLPVSARQAPTTRPTYPVPTTAIFIRVPTPSLRLQRLKRYHSVRNAVNILTSKRLPLQILRVVPGAAALLAFSTVRILLDYRPALEGTDRVGEHAHELGGRPGPPTAARRRACALHKLLGRSPRSGRGFRLATNADRGPAYRCACSPTPGIAWGGQRSTGWPDQPTSCSRSILLIPSGGAQSAVTVHDLDFLHHPERTSAEIRRDYAALVRDHWRARRWSSSTPLTRRAPSRRLSVSRANASSCADPGFPPGLGRRWTADRRRMATSCSLARLEPRKNLGALLDAWVDLSSRMPDLPRLRIAGGLRPGGEGWVSGCERLPRRSSRLRDMWPAPTVARCMKAPDCWCCRRSTKASGLPVLEAMSLGIPVVTSDRGALPEVVGDAGLTVDAGGSAGARRCDPRGADGQGSRGGHARARPCTRGGLQLGRGGQGAVWRLHGVDGTDGTRCASALTGASSADSPRALAGYSAAAAAEWGPQRGGPRTPVHDLFARRRHCTPAGSVR